VSEEKNRLTVSIYGKNYTIVGDESPEYMRTLAGYVDEVMHRVGQGNTRLDTSKLAILTALNIANDYFRLRQKYEELENKLKNGKNRS
jgi:cell division protein ZapA